MAENDVKALSKSREKIITKTSVIGILTNLILVGFKAFVGFISNSIAVILDAVNNLSDALSSFITMVGNFLAGRKPDKKHPLGHGRVEYLTAMVVAALVIYAGITACVESVKKIITPETPDYSAVSLIIIGVAVVVKIALGLYFRLIGKKVNSAALSASGTDALFDAVISTSVLVSAIVFVASGLSLEAYVGVLISLFIIKAGFSMLKETLDDIVGHRADRELVSAIKKTVCEDPCVHGAYDLIIHSYGPEKHLASIHVEIPDVMTADEIDEMERRIAHNVYIKHNVILVGIGIYALNTKDDDVKNLRSRVIGLITTHDGVLQVHGFNLNKETATVSVDVILDFEIPDMQAEIDAIKKELETVFPQYTFRLTMDIDA
ncbi:MAG: cation transporter [Clostridia bacterium]|nr:cation transporter [Clostridia bacterium]